MDGVAQVFTRNFSVVVQMTMRKTLTLFFVLVAMVTAGSSRQSAQRGQPNLERQ